MIEGRRDLRSQMEPSAGRSPIDWGAVSRGVSVGLAVIVPVTIVRAVLDRDLTDLSHSGWIYPLSALILVAYGLGRGLVSGDRAALPPGLVVGALVLGLLVGMAGAGLVVWTRGRDGRVSAVQRGA
jgi:hypothetical protein